MTLVVAIPSHRKHGREPLEGFSGQVYNLYTSLPYTIPVEKTSPKATNVVAQPKIPAIVEGGRNQYWRIAKSYCHRKDEHRKEAASWS